MLPNDSGSLMVLKSARILPWCSILRWLGTIQRIIPDWLPVARYSPGRWAHGVLLCTDDPKIAGNIGSGGLRIAVPISGYAAFGWFGVVLMSAVAGFFTGYLVRFAKRHVKRSSIEQSAVVIAMYLGLSRLALSPTSMMWQEVLQPIILAWLIYTIERIGWNRQLSGLVTSTETNYEAE